MIGAGTSVDVPGWLAILVVILGAIGTVGAAVAVSRSASLKASMDAQSASMELIIAANAELRHVNEDMRKDLEQERRSRANLEGKLEVFTSHFADRIVDAVITTIKTAGPLVAAVSATNNPPQRNPSARERSDDR